MKRKQIALFMNVGTGVKSDTEDSGYMKEAKKLYSTINKLYAHYVVFFASSASQETIKHIEKLFELGNDEFVQGQDYEIVMLEAIDDFNSCFEAVEYKIWQMDYLNEEDQYDIILDYSSGTRTMSAAMACCGMFYGREIVSVGGDRSKGEVSAGTEIIHHQNLYMIYDKFALMRSRSYFNANSFKSAIHVLDMIIDSKIYKQALIDLCMGYYAWDSMDFDAAYEHLTKVDSSGFEFLDIRDELKMNMKALGNIVHTKSENLKNCYVLASLINNAKRRAEEYKYDDAIARLYRSFELIAQIRLNKYGLTSSDIDISILKDNGASDEFIKTLEKTKEDGKIRIGLIMDYVLLSEIGDDLGKYYTENENRIKDLTQKRNHSILAHGLESQSKEDFDKFLELVIELAKKLDKDMDRFLNETKFAKFDLKLEINVV